MKSRKEIFSSFRARGSIDKSTNAVRTRKYSWERRFGFSKKEYENASPEEKSVMARSIDRHLEHSFKRLSQAGMQTMEEMFYREDTPAELKFKIWHTWLQYAIGKPKQQISQQVEVTVSGYAEALEKARMRTVGSPKMEALPNVIDVEFEEEDEDE